MKEVHLITEVKLELNNLIRITVPYWLHLWVSLWLHETCLQDPPQAGIGLLSGIPRSETLATEQPVLSWTYCHMPKL